LIRYHLGEKLSLTPPWAFVRMEALANDWRLVYRQITGRAYPVRRDCNLRDEGLIWYLGEAGF
jgi:hypothetical protein